MNNSQKVTQLKKNIQGCTASIAHKSDLKNDLLRQVRELDMEINEDLAKREFYRLSLKDINEKEGLL